MVGSGKQEFCFGIEGLSRGNNIKSKSSVSTYIFHFIFLNLPTHVPNPKKKKKIIAPPSKYTATTRFILVNHQLLLRYTQKKITRYHPRQCIAKFSTPTTFQNQRQCQRRKNFSAPTHGCLLGQNPINLKKKRKKEKKKSPKPKAAHQLTFVLYIIESKGAYKPLSPNGNGFGFRVMNNLVWDGFCEVQLDH